jgi:DNA-binding PadR family transcriptional regulator
VDDFQWRVLNTAAKRGYFGASREDLFSDIRGVRYKELEEAVRTLESEGLVKVEWTGPNKFVVNITEKGNEMVRVEYEERLAAYEKKIDEQKAEAPEESASLFQCGNCNALVSSDAKQCPECGAKFED